MLEGMERTILLHGKESVVSVVKDDLCCTYSIAINDGYYPNVKFISEELYNLLVKELGEIESKEN